MATLIKKKKSEGEREILLRLLERVESDASISQEQFAKQIGIAKGLANAYFNRCIEKGWIKLRQVPKQRFLYYLTPRGFAEKARLSAQFLVYSYRFYREARADFVALMVQAAERGHRRLAVLGDGELAEIAAIVSDDSPVEIVGFIARDAKRRRIAGRLVVANWADLESADGAVLATLDDTASVYGAFRAEQPTVAVFVPAHLRSLVWKKPK